MFRLWFENRFGERIFICDYENEKDTVSLIYKDLAVRAQPSFKSYYIRSWKNPCGETVYDCGSWCEYYIAAPI